MRAQQERQVNTFIALLRGVNVGGKNILPMKALRNAMENAGFGNVRTYIQSGNIVFESSEANRATLASQVSRCIKASHGFEPLTHILSAAQLRQAIEENPYASRDVEANQVHFYFLERTPSQGVLEQAQQLAANEEECAIIGSVFYLFTPNGIGRSKLAARAEKTLGVAATARNLRSALKILNLAESNVT